MRAAPYGAPGMLEIGIAPPGAAIDAGTPRDRRPEAPVPGRPRRLSHMFRLWSLGGNHAIGEYVVMAQPRLSELTRDECMSLLATAVVGRVGLSVDALPVVLPVNFAVSDQDIVFRTVEGTKFHAAAAGAVVAFEADAYEPSGRSGWSARRAPSPGCGGGRLWCQRPGPAFDLDR